MIRFGRSVSAACLAAILAAPGALFAGEDKLTVEDANSALRMMADAKLTLKSAIEMAEKDTKGNATAVRAMLPKQALRIEVGLLADQKVWNAYIDQTAKVVEKKQAEKGDATQCATLVEALKDAKLTLDKAIMIAEKETKGHALAAVADMKKAEGEKDVFVRVTLLVESKIVVYIVDKNGKATEEVTPTP